MDFDKATVMGAENEYSLAGNNGGRRISPEYVHELLLTEIERRYSWVSDGSGRCGVFVENGSRYYLDVGAHAEWATAECFTPREVTCQDRAGERILIEARDAVCRQNTDLKISIFKMNLDPVVPDRVTIGGHESYLSWIPLTKCAPLLIPHIVSRVVYGGAGCLSAHPEGMGFELSQRARHLVEPVGKHTTTNRAIFCTRSGKARDRGPDGWRRVHLIARDSQRSPLGIYLTFGTTALIFALVSAGHRVGESLKLQDPVRAIRQISLDPSLQVKVPLSSGKSMSALEMQRRYLDECRRLVRPGYGPVWAPELLGRWEETLEALAESPYSLSRRLDAYLKLLAYEHELRRAGHDWAGLREGLQWLSELRARYPSAVTRAVISGEADGVAGELRHVLETARREVGMRGEEALERLRFAVRMQVLDTRFHELGGLYDGLEQEGEFERVVVSSEEIKEAMREPPRGGRAEARSKWIRSSRNGEWSCDWAFVVNAQTGERVPTGDPFSPEPPAVRRG